MRATCMAMPSYMDPGKGGPSEEQQHMGPGLRLTRLTPVLEILFLSAPSIFQVSLHQAPRLPFPPWSLLLRGHLPPSFWALPSIYQFDPSTPTTQTGELLPAACPMP